MSLSELCVRRPVFATMLVSMLLVLGIFSFRDLGVDLFPRADAASVNVTLLLPSASPDEMVTQVVQPVEDALSTVAGIDQLNATIIEGSANIGVRFVLERDLNDAATDVREKVAAAVRNLPPQMLPPVIRRADPDADPIMTLVITAKNMSLVSISEIADKQIKRVLEQVDGVGQVDLGGDVPREVHIVVDVEKLNAYGLTIDQVRSAVQSDNIDVPGGAVRHGTSQAALRTLGSVAATQQFDDIIVATVGHTPIKIRDIGYSEDSFQEPSTSNWMDGSPSIQVDIRRVSGENTVRVANAIKAKLTVIQRTLPRGMTIVTVKDTSAYIYASVAALEEHLLWGSLLAAAVVMFFIRNIRAVIISALAIPTSIISTFTIMRAMDFTLNNMTLLGLTLAVGIVIDDAIVVLENIFRYIEEKNCTPFEAAIQGTREVTLAVMATTLSLVVIFLPVAFMNGYARRFIYPFGLTMAFSIMVSMLVSFTLTPMLSSRFLKLSDALSDNKTKESGFFKRLDDWYARSLEWSLANPWLIIGASVLVFALSYPLNRMVGREFIPEDDQGMLQLHIDLPEGTSLKGTEEAVKNILIPELSNVEGVAHIGALNGADKANHTHIFLYLDPLDQRKVTQAQVVERVRQILAPHVGMNPIIAVPSSLGGGGGAGGFAIDATVMGPDLDQVGEYSARLLSMGAQTPSLGDSKTTFASSSPEIQVHVDRPRAADLGVRMSTIGNTLRLMVSGEDQVSVYREGPEQYPVKIKVLDNQRRDINTIAKLTVGSTTAGPVRIDNIAQIERGYGSAQIRRQNRMFSVEYQANIAAGHTLGEASTDARRNIAKLNLAPGYTVRLAGQTQQLDETTANMILAIGLAGIFVYMVLAAQFESFIQPIVIMLVLPLAVPFALFSLWATGRALNLWSALGILLLFGIVKKNSILQVDYANVLRARGVPLHEAIVEACRTRMRPILMTTSAILAGLIPTALGLGVGASQRSAIAVTIIGGQSLCLFLTLLLVPVAYVKFDALEQSLANKPFGKLVKKLTSTTVGRLRPAPAAAPTE